MRRGIGPIIALVLIVAACSSGPAPDARQELPSTTTTTEPPPEGIYIVLIENGKLTPSNLEIDLDEFWIVRWENHDPPREYTIISRDAGLFESPLLLPGDSWEFDFHTLDEGLHRYNTFIGAQRIPGYVETRPPAG